jgi:dihydrofolate reductase
MRKLTASFFVSLDGVVESPEKWHFPYFSEEMGAVIGAAISSADAFLLGRRTYEQWAAYWPEQPAENPMAQSINGLPKYVASQTLDKVEWQNSTLLRGDVGDEVAKLKKQPGGDIAISGSATLVRSLLAAGLIDELRLMLHPLVVGSGDRLFPNGSVPTPLELRGSQELPNGVVDLAYVRASAA